MVEEGVNTFQAPLMSSQLLQAMPGLIHSFPVGQVVHFIGEVILLNF